MINLFKRALGKQPVRKSKATFGSYPKLSRKHPNNTRKIRGKKDKGRMLQMFFAVAFSAVPLTLYIPPVRSLSLFVETMEELFRESSSHTNRLYPRLRFACSRILNCLLPNYTRQIIDSSVFELVSSLVFFVLKVHINIFHFLLLH